MAAMSLAVPPTPAPGQRGFTLIELAIVMFIVTLLLGGMLLPLSAQQDIRNFGDTQKKLADARDALLGFAMANDRLPCPASATSNGQESFCTSSSGGCAETTLVQSHGRCAYPYSGYFPAATLGFSPVDAQGYMVDGWGGETVNWVRYAVTTNSTSSTRNNAFTSASGMKNASNTVSGVTTTGMTALVPDLQICSTGANLVTATPDTAACDTGKSLATDAVAVVYSLGKNAGTGGTSTDESHNLNADRAFVNAVQSSTFDDQMLWLSKSTLFNRMVAAGRLP